MSRHEVASRRVLYEIPGMQSVRVEESTFPGANGEPLPLQIYEPINPLGDCVVAIVGAFPDHAFEKHVGCTFREMEWTIGMARLVAASGMTAVTHATCGVLNNPMTGEFRPNTPLFIIRAGKDETPGLNLALDRYLARALAENKPVTLVNYPEAPHSYELSVDAPETRRILQQGLDFLRAQLG